MNATTSEMLQQTLRAHGLRATPQRLAIAAMVLAHPTHVSAREVWQQLHHTYPSLSLNTVYQTLSLLESKGLLQRLEIDGITFFDSNPEPHDHACCIRCKAILDLPSNPVQPPSELAEWHILGERRIWQGLCPACRTSLSTR